MKMKKFLSALCGAIIVVLLILAPAVIGGTIETHYFLKATVSAVVLDEIKAIDENGDTWVFEGDNFTSGDKIKLYMNTNLTDHIKEDDIVENAWKTR